jgi:ribosomal protein S18 acetylase RimI-like enzyme
MQDPLIIRLMQPADLDTLQSICRSAYSQNFGHHWQEGGLSDYLEKVFGTDTLAAELADPHVRYYVAFREQGPVAGAAGGESGAAGGKPPPAEPVAFMKLNLCPTLPGALPEKGIELDKLYILPQCKGQNIGGRLMDLAFRVAETAGKDSFWLAVIDSNTAAIAFYEKYGFRFHSTTRVSYSKFREELKGMWRMRAQLKKVAAGL